VEYDVTDILVVRGNNCLILGKAHGIIVWIKEAKQNGK